MTAKLEAVFKKVSALPPEQQDMIADQLLAELEDENAPHNIAPENSITGKELAESGLFGIWKDRTDIGDSLEFARKLRKQAETRHHEIDDPK